MYHRMWSKDGCIGFGDRFYRQLSPWFPMCSLSYPPEVMSATYEMVSEKKGALSIPLVPPAKPVEYNHSLDTSDEP